MSLRHEFCGGKICGVVNIIGKDGPFFQCEDKWVFGLLAGNIICEPNTWSWFIGVQRFVVVVQVTRDFDLTLKVNRRGLKYRHSSAIACLKRIRAKSRGLTRISLQICCCSKAYRASSLDPLVKASVGSIV